MVEPEEAIQEAVVAVGSWPVRAVRRPARACPRDKETPWLPGRVCCPHTEKGALLTPPSQARRATVPGSLPVAVRGQWVPGAGCSVPACQKKWDKFPRSAAGRPASGPWPVLLLPPPPAQARLRLPPPLALAWRPAGPRGPELL